MTFLTKRSFRKSSMMLLPLGLSLVLAFHCAMWGMSPVKTLSSLGHGIVADPKTRQWGGAKPALDVPQIVWLASYPNSGTSYTMLMVEESSNRSTATNYGLEVTDYKYPSIPLHSHHPEGPYWEGSRKHILPETGYILTKTHCGGRCVRCGAKQYVANASTYLDACARTTARLGKSRRTEDNHMDPKRVAKVVHLIRNPFTNVVARFHMESRNMFRREKKTAQWLPKNATGLRNFCQALDEIYGPEEEGVLDADLRKLMADVPCRAEFYKWTQCKDCCRPCCCFLFSWWLTFCFLLPIGRA